ncbi:MAG: hypothetical protein ABR507_10300, partial [Actinomycetota bacterium]
LGMNEGTKLGMKAGRDLFMFLTLAAEEQLIGGWLGRGKEIIGVTSIDYSGVAWIRVRNTRTDLKLSELFVASKDAERFLLRLVNEWRSLGQPSPTDLRIHVTFSRPATEESWRRKRLQGCWLDIEFSRA